VTWVPRDSGVLAQLPFRFTPYQVRHIGVLRAGRKDLMPGALAPNPRPVDTDPLHCFHLLGQPPTAGPNKHTGVMAPVTPSWVSGIA
jgi:hypothetical protein